MRWSDDKLALAIGLLQSGRFATVNDVAADLGTTRDALKFAFSSRGFGPPSTYLTADTSCKQSKPQEVSSSTTIMMVSDVHVPYHDKRAWETAVAASEDLKPDVIVIGGDFLDCYVCSKFDKAPTRFSLLSDELREARTELAKLNASRVIYVEGNHEHRLTSYVIRNAAPLAGLVSIESALRIRERGWQWVPYPQHVTIGDLRIQHEPMLGGKYGAIRTLESGGAISWAFGHTHTGQVASMGTPDGSEIHAVNTGWLGDFDSLAFDYCSPAMARQRWRHGFGLFYQDRGKTISAQFVQIINGACVVNGRRVAA